MALYDSVYAELSCPFCGRAYRHAPLTWAKAESECRRRQAHERNILAGVPGPLGSALARRQSVQAERDGFRVRPGEHQRADLLAWIEHLAAPERIEQWRTRPTLGLVEIQTRALGGELRDYFVGDPVPPGPGPLTLEERFICQGCSRPGETVLVTAWIEIRDHTIQAVRTHHPDTGEPERQVYPTEREEAGTEG